MNFLTGKNKPNLEWKTMPTTIQPAQAVEDTVPFEPSKSKRYCIGCRCDVDIGTWDLTARMCAACKDKSQTQRAENLAEQKRQHERKGRKIVMTTTPTVPAKEIGDVCGLVHSEVAYGMNLLKDVATAWRDTFGGRAQSLQGVMSDSRKTAVAEMEEQARAMDADAIVGLSFQITQINTTNGTGMVILAATGTAVRFADKELSK
ncbi:YbjQ family protein [Phyllobacterium bourgognense]|uniref:UPF0145 protein C7476_109201 n=1 Tax=Phyllobacterium bourgognense TaxID=314236 RepID=A0A368YQX8_9HYPH|nr:YbjQ family protein [Phyllobacterium bourgognense]RCW82019.1 uncharacterized protein YbjQ (UPF0145 family) [Phyllobacterium bourgognense]